MPWPSPCSPSCSWPSSNSPFSPCSPPPNKKVPRFPTQHLTWKILLSLSNIKENRAKIIQNLFLAKTLCVLFIQIADSTSSLETLCALDLNKKYRSETTTRRANSKDKPTQVCAWNLHTPAGVVFHSKSLPNRTTKACCHVCAIFFLFNF